MIASKEESSMGIEQSATVERRALVLSLMAERERTGETWRVLATRSGMAYPTLTGWVWRLRREQSDPKASRSDRGFVELVAKDRPRAERDGFDLVLRGKRRIRVGVDFDEAALSRLVRVLEGC
jgi:hypothetical protein